MLGPRSPYPATHGRNPSIPNADDLKNDVLKRRSIGRNYGHYGGAETVVFLPEGKTVAGVVRDVVENALRGAGYRIVDPGSAESSGALKLKAIINDYWGWSAAGSRFRQNIQLSLLGDWPLENEYLDRDRSQTTIENIWFPKDSWKALFEKSNPDFRVKLKELLC